MNEDDDIQLKTEKSNSDNTQVHTTPATDSFHHEQFRQPSPRSMYELFSLVTALNDMSSDSLNELFHGRSFIGLRLSPSPSRSTSNLSPTKEESFRLDPDPPVPQLAHDSVMREAVDFLHSDNELILACELGDEKKVSELIRNGVDVNLRDAIGRTALHFAVQTDNIRIITMLLNAGADATKRDNVSLTPLSICLMRKPSVKVAKLLFDHGAVILPRQDPVETGLFLQFAMMCTPTKEEVEILALLIEKGALINDPHVPGGRSALHFAAMSNNCNLIHALLHLGANIFAVNHRGETPLDVAVTFRCKQAIDCLSRYMTW